MIDAHLHVWDRTRLRYDWLSGALDRDYRLEDTLPTLHANGVTGCVLVEAHGSFEEAQWLLQVAAANEIVLGVVAGLEVDGAETLNLEHPKLKGVRIKISSQTDWDALERTLETVASNDWSCDLLLLEPRIPAPLATLCARHPRVRFVLDHLGGARIDLEQHATWAEEISAFVGLEHVAVKLSGFLTAAPQALEAATLEPFVRTALEIFGAGRCMYGSDYPVCTLRGGYADTVAMLERLLNHLEPADRDAIWFGTTAQVYGLETPERQLASLAPLTRR